MRSKKPRPSCRNSQASSSTLSYHLLPFCLVFLLSLVGQTTSSSDPTCSTGVASGDVCCAGSCGTCGGSKCGSRPGGGSSCCTKPIIKADESCYDHLPPCIMEPPENLPADSVCATGVLSGTICCGGSCGTCGGSGCSGRPGGASACCTTPISSSKLSCFDNPPPCIKDLPVNPGDPVNPFCATSNDDLEAGTEGIRDVATGACCAASCGSCGDDTTPDSAGKTCSERSGGSHKCCVAAILANAPASSNSNSCEFHEPPCYSKIDNGITFENWDDNGSSNQWDPLNTVISSCEDSNSNTNNQCVETSFVPSDKGSERVTGLTPIPKGLEYTLTYDVKFDNNFEFVKGGKLHGVGPVDHISGCSPMTDTGWSARVMWREQGELSIYVYHQDKTYNCGHLFRSGSFFTTGQWETVSLYVKVNTAYNVFDGKVQLYLNGQLVAEALNLRFVDQQDWAVPHPEGYIQNFIFSAFHGGSNTDWSPTTTQKAWIDNISVVPGHSVPSPASRRLKRSSTGKAATVLPAPKSFDAHDMTCEDEGAIPFDDGPRKKKNEKNSNLRHKEKNQKKVQEKDIKKKATLKKKGNVGES